MNKLYPSATAALAVAEDAACQRPGVPAYRATASGRLLTAPGPGQGPDRGAACTVARSGC